MNGDTCSSDLLALKIQQLDALIQIIRRTLDSSDASIYLAEAINLMEAASEMAKDCETLRRKIDVELYGKNSKHCQLYSKTAEDVN